MNNTQIEIIPTDSLIPYARNSRTHSDAQVAQIAASIREFGFTNPVLVDKDGGIIAGHGRVLAASKLQLSDVPCLRLGHLTDTQKRAYVIADNKLALNAGWDDEMLRVEFGELDRLGFNLELTGFIGDDLTRAMFGDLDNADSNDSSDDEELVDKSRHLLLVEFNDERSLEELFDELKNRGLSVKVMS